MIRWQYIAILDLQPDFMVVVQVMTAGHLCIFLPKSHCELNLSNSFRVQPRSMYLLLFRFPQSGNGKLGTPDD